MEQNVTDAQALELLKDSCEISNQAMIDGTLCRDPQSFTSKKGKTTTNYQLAVNRKYFIKDGDPMVKTDYQVRFQFTFPFYGILPQNVRDASHPIERKK